MAYSQHFCNSTNNSQNKNCLVFTSDEEDDCLSYDEIKALLRKNSNISKICAALHTEIPKDQKQRLAPLCSAGAAAVCGGGGPLCVITSNEQNKSEFAKKKVTFSPETKRHDGLSIVKKLFDESVIDGIEHRKFSNIEEYIEYIGKDNIKYLKDVYKLLEDMIKKIEIKIKKEPKGTVPILPGGGGSCAKLGGGQIEWLIWFKELIEYII